MSATYDLNRMLGNYMDAADELAEPPTLLPAVFTATRGMQQRRGLVGRVQTMLSGASLSWTVRPVLTYAIIILLLVVMTFAVAFAAGLLRPPTIPTGWRVLDANPSEFTFVNQVSTIPAGFIAIGMSSVLDTDCTTGEDRGRVWTSTDGDQWTDQSDEVPGFRPESVFNGSKSTYLVGHEVVCYNENGGEPVRGMLFRLGDGFSLEAVATPDDMFQWGNPPTLVEANDTLVAIGPYQEASPDGEFASPAYRVWALEVETWEHLSDLRGFQMEDLAASGNVVVAIGGLENEPRRVIQTSIDGGRSWTAQDLPAGVAGSIAFLAAGHGRFVAAGDDAALVSTNGLSWTPADTTNGALNGVTGLIATSGGYLVVREDREDDGTADACREVGQPPAPYPSNGSPRPEWTPNPNPVMTCTPLALDGGTSFSADGLHWTSGPDLPRPTDTSASGGRMTVAAGDAGLVAVDSSRQQPMVWYSPLEPFLTGD
jgi:hypothetical protein